ncbi:GNAT family N-acetyltransferase [Dermacoccus nishinomiyaensis]
MPDLTLTKNTDANRYEAWDGDALAGFVEYQLTDQRIVFTHTEVDPSYEGKGVGSQVARFALDDVRADGTHDVLPLCPFIKGWIGRHREYVDLVHGAPETTAKGGRIPAEPKGPDGVPRVDSPDAASDPHRPSESDGTDGVRRVDVIVIGGGPTGENVAQYAHDGGLSVLLIEGELLGGECSYYACMPSKALLRPLDVRATSEHLPGLRPAELDVAALLARRDAWVSDYDDTSQLDWATGAGLDVMRGHARLIGEKTVSVSF